VNVAAALPWMRDAHVSGQEYTSTAWQTSPTVAFAATIAEGLAIYSNDPYALRFIAGRDAVMIPLDFVPVTGRANPRYEAEFRTMCRAFVEERAVLVWLRRSGPWFEPVRQRVESTCTPLGRRELADGTIYGGPAAATKGQAQNDRLTPN